MFLMMFTRATSVCVCVIRIVYHTMDRDEKGGKHLLMPLGVRKSQSGTAVKRVSVDNNSG